MSLNLPSSSHQSFMSSFQCWWTIMSFLLFLPSQRNTRPAQIWSNKCKVLHLYTPSKSDSTDALHIAASDRCSLSQWSWQLIIWDGAWGGGGRTKEWDGDREEQWVGWWRRKEGGECFWEFSVWVYIALLWSVSPLGTAISHRPLPCIVSHAMHNTETYRATCRLRHRHTDKPVSTHTHTHTDVS